MRRFLIFKCLSILVLLCVFMVFWGQVNTSASEMSFVESEDIYNGDARENYLLSEYEVVVEILEKTGDEYVLMFTLMNENDFCISDWSIIFEANYVVKVASDVEVIEQAQIKHIRCLDKNKYIKNGESISFEIRVSSSEEIIADSNYRVYGSYDTSKMRFDVQELERKACLDIIQYDMKTEEYSLGLNDIEDILKVQQEDTIVDSNIDSLPHIATQVDPYSIIGGDGRDRVSNVRANPYSGIVFLKVTNFNGKISYATGFVISDYYLATAAHVVYTAKKIEVYTHLEGITYDYRHETSKYAYCASFPSAQVPANDWAVVEFEEDIGNEVQRLSIGYTEYDYQVSTMNYSVCGYPGDMAVVDPNGHGIGGKARYMYYASSAISGYTNEELYYSADTYAGQSGSPVYNTHTNTVYGIHVAGGTTANGARRFTRELYNLFIQENWID